MVIKSIAKETSRKKEDVYPCLKKVRSIPERVVLFHAPGAGMVIHTDGDWLSIGHYAESWGGYPRDWEDYCGTIELSTKGVS